MPSLVSEERPSVQRWSLQRVAEVCCRCRGKQVVGCQRDGLKDSMYKATTKASGLSGQSQGECSERPRLVVLEAKDSGRQGQG